MIHILTFCSPLHVILGVFNIVSSVRHDGEVEVAAVQVVAAGGRSFVPEMVMVMIMMIMLVMVMVMVMIMLVVMMMVVMVMQCKNKTLFLLGNKLLSDAKHGAEEDAMRLQPVDVGFPGNRGTSERPDKSRGQSSIVNMVNL